jgi:hypothetical protein
MSSKLFAVITVSTENLNSNEAIIIFGNEMHFTDEDSGMEEMKQFEVIDGVGALTGNSFLYTFRRGIRRRSWLRHCATNWKVTGSILDGDTGIFQ